MYPFNLIRRHVPRWIVFLMELMMVAASFAGSWFLVLVLFPDQHLALPSLAYLAVYLMVNAAAIMMFKTYAGVIRHSGIEDVQKVCVFTVVQGCFLLSSAFYFHLNHTAFLVLLAANFCVLTTSMICFRLIVRYIFHVSKKSTVPQRRVLIFGAGYLGMATKNAIDLDKWSGKEVVGFIDEDPSKVGKLLNGVQIFSIGDAARKFIVPAMVDEIILAIRQPNPEAKNFLYEQCADKEIQITEVPPLNQWINGGFRVNQLQHLSIESLLERKEIVIGNEKTTRFFSGATILVTGAAGSIGSEICRQLLKHSPAKLVVLDHAESPLHDLVLELKGLNESVALVMEVASVRDKLRIDQVFRKHRFQYVFHAAAYKHVPLMEQFPSESVLTNVLGTKNLADAAKKYGVRKFIMVSTDKAVNPTNIMGACKRLAELYVQSLTGQCATRFITTRFGNVLGSQGSVVPFFKKQILQGQPVTVTHPDITRYFMTIPEACRLVLEACVMGKGGEIFVFDMGEPVKIVDLAKKMIRLAGFRPDIDIPIQFTGLRPGEKMYEELFKDSEQLMPTYHPKIMTAKRSVLVDEASFSYDMHELIDAATQHRQKLVSAKIRAMLPEFQAVVEAVA